MSSHKRKPDHHVGSSRPPKKPRSENAPSLHGGPSQDVVDHADYPELPSIHSRFIKPVFTHCSKGEQNPDDPTLVNYERLEFLGDAQLEHIASLVIFERYSSASPGKMSTLRESLLRNHVLCDFSRMYGFDKRLLIGASLSEVTRDHLVKIHADVFEAYVAAVILSDEDYHRGFETVRKWLTALWEPMLAKLGMPASILMSQSIKHKENLAKMVLVKGIKLHYVEEKPPMHIKSRGLTTYFVGVYLTGWGLDNQHLGSGEGLSKTEAGQEAAKIAIENPRMEEIKAKRIQFLLDRERDEQAVQDKQ